MATAGQCLQHRVAPRPALPACHPPRRAFAGSATTRAARSLQPVEPSQPLRCHRLCYGRQGHGRPAVRVAGASVRAEQSYIMIKPDGVQRGLVGEIIGRFERKGFTLKGLKLFQCSKELAEEHYKDLSSKPFFNDLVAYIISGPVVAMVWEGKGVVKSARKLIGATNPLEAEPGTIRGDFAVQTGRNVVHGSDSPENGEREIELWFGGSGTVEWAPTIMPWLKE